MAPDEATKFTFFIPLCRVVDIHEETRANLYLGTTLLCRVRACKSGTSIDKTSPSNDEDIKKLFNRDGATKTRLAYANITDMLVMLSL